MNGLPHERELPELNDDQIVLLDTICKAASRLPKGPFKALTQEYSREFRERGLDTSRDDAVFRWLMRVGDSARRQYRDGTRTDFVPYLRSILEAHGITVIDEEQNGEIDGVTRSLEEAHTPRREKIAQPRRRVSFHDARLEETWLSERSTIANASPVHPQEERLGQPRRAGGDWARTQRARSVSSERPFGPRQPAPKHYQEASPSSDYTSEHEEQQNPVHFFELSQAQLERNADSFLDISDRKVARKYFHALHDAALVLRNLRAHEYARAAAHDERQLLKNSFDCMIGLYRARRHDRERHRREQEESARRNAQLQSILDVAEQKRSRWLVYWAFTHWSKSVAYQNRKTELGLVLILRKKYFNRWRRLTLENNQKAVQLQQKKFLRRWHSNTTNQRLEYQRIDAEYEESLLRKILSKWVTKLRKKRHEDNHEKRIERSALYSWHVRLQQQRAKNNQAQAFRAQHLARSALGRLARICDQRRSQSVQATAHFDYKISSRCMSTLRIYAKLSPVASTLSCKMALTLKEKAFKVWHLHWSLSQQATNVDRRRVLQHAWTTWNDSLRCKALAQRIDERVLFESLRKWMLRARQHDFQRRCNSRLVRGALTTWRQRREHSRTAVEQASASFEEAQWRRRLAHGMFCLNLEIRNREEAERAAVEFSNSRALPDVLAVWKQRTEHARMLAKWAADARFYCLSTRTLKLWQEKTTEHRHNRRREAYAHIRARVKIRIARTSLERLHEKSVEIHSMRTKANDRAQARLFMIGTNAFDKLHEMSARYVDLEIKATAADQQKLLVSSFSAMIDKHAELATLEQQALSFRQESDLALLASALKRLQWMTFTAARRAETADALKARNRDQHIKHMIRHWASQAAARKEAKNAPADEPESPSLRPASRTATRSAERATFPSSPPAQTATPGYMRTPSRSRRAARFRPLPTPAHVTPMAFDQSYLVTTPAPLVSARPTRDFQGSGQSEGVFEGLTPQITPFARKLRAGGVTAAPPSALKTSVLGRSVTGGTNKSVRFAGSSRFGSGRRRLGTTDE